MVTRLLLVCCVWIGPLYCDDFAVRGIGHHPWHCYQPAVMVQVSFVCAGFVREAFLEFYPEEAVKDLEPASFFEKYKTNRISLQQAKDYEEVLVKRCDLLCC